MGRPEAAKMNGFEALNMLKQYPGNIVHDPNNTPWGFADIFNEHTKFSVRDLSMEGWTCEEVIVEPEIPKEFQGYEVWEVKKDKSGGRYIHYFLDSSIQYTLDCIARERRWSGLYLYRYSQNSEDFIKGTLPRMKESVGDKLMLPVGVLMVKENKDA